MISILKTLLFPFASFIRLCNAEHAVPVWTGIQKQQKCYQNPPTHMWKQLDFEVCFLLFKVICKTGHYKKLFIHKGLGRPRLVLMCPQQTARWRGNHWWLVIWHNYRTLPYVFGIIQDFAWPLTWITVYKVRMVCTVVMSTNNNDWLKENITRRESLTMMDCWDHTCRANNTSITGWPEHMLGLCRRIKTFWTVLSPHHHHHLRLTMARGDYCLSSQADDWIWVWKQRCFFPSFGLHLHIKKRTGKRRAGTWHTLVCLETFLWKTHSCAEN